MKTPIVKKPDLLYPELSFRIIGILFDVDNQLGCGHKEKYYENAVAAALDKSGISYKRQVYAPLEYNGDVIGKYFFDFFIEEKIILELKQGNFFSQQNIKQVYSYLKVHDIKLGIIAQFTSEGLKYKRIVNVN